MLWSLLAASVHSVASKTMCVKWFKAMNVVSVSTDTVMFAKVTSSNPSLSKSMQQSSKRTALENSKGYGRPSPRAS
ncbi:MAG: hypothetical protein EOP10_26150 [Proteobacteria bacterium]|nr:MAG: hypothetical protein EOP10_26150 [Pseudomonadota bacterium]